MTLEKQIAEDYGMLLKEAQSMGCNKINALYNIPLDNMKAIVNALEEVQKYRAIGTPDECRAAVEKQRAKKPKKTESEGYRYTDTYRCPNCGGNFSGTGIANYCYHCGQKLDWGDVE